MAVPRDFRRPESCSPSAPSCLRLFINIGDARVSSPSVSEHDSKYPYDLNAVMTGYRTVYRVGIFFQLEDLFHT